MSEISPNQSIHIGNLNSKIRPDELRASLYSLCITYGRIIDVVPPTTIKMRGQAFVIFRDISSATIAKRQLDGFHFFGKPMVVNYAKAKSDAVAKLDGTIFEQIEERKKLRRFKKYGKANGTADNSAEAEANSDDQGMADSEDENKGEMDSSEPAVSRRRRTSAGEQSGESDTQASKKQKTNGTSPNIDNSDNYDDHEDNVANSTLFMQNLPESVSNQMLSALFEQYPGFKEVRRVPGKPQLAFVDYDTVPQASHARDILSGFKISPSLSLDILFAKI